ncbi:LVIVD repeat-containing protein [Natronococcus sp.]|uniref:LVIVD repeat-containing protein n=1 Tax=Natronococcus sp. TaxID=35747 RepID=UPI0025D028E3|nr:twin-arginine translocation signal domain-containing protein [Natronococcus sp.]
MFDSSRRDVLKYSGIAAVAAGGVGTGTVSGGEGTTDDDGSGVPGTLERLGHDFLENPPGIYTYGAVREDGKYAVMGGYYGEGGSFLVDLSDLENPEQAHRVPSANTNRQNDVKFDPRDGLYYRTLEPNIDGGRMGFQVIDYGYDVGTVEEPEIVATVETPRTGVHKLEEHPEKPILYPIDKDGEEPGLLIYDVSDPSEPEYLSEFGPDGYCHDLEVDIGRELIHAAYIGGDFVGYVIFDISDPYEPEELSRVDYAELPDYEEIGEPGFQSCHQASFDPERDLAVVGDEIGSGIPGGKHVYDIGWDEGSPEDPIHIGFTHSPNAREQGEDEPFFWTTHFHNVVPCDGGITLLVDGGYHEGVWVADITDPRNPTHAQSYPTHEDEDLIAQLGSGPVVELLDGLHPPFVWSIEYNEARNFVFASDSLTGAYTFELSPEKFEFRTILEEIKRTYEPRDEVGADGLELAHHYHAEHATVPNTGGEEMTEEALAEVEAVAEEEGVEIEEFEMAHH